MMFLPQASGSRPRLACEITAGGVVAARSPESGAPLAAVAKVALEEGTIVPSLKPGNIAGRVATVAALRGALDRVGAKPHGRDDDLTLVIPDAAVRVLLLDFDSLPNKLSEALPIVRFRLKKLVPFDADEAMVSFQVMSTSRSVVRVLAVAVPRDVLSEYESIAREAGFEPGAVLPSTLAALAALPEADGASLVVNAHETGVTTAIVRSGIVLLHRTVELAEHAPATPAALPSELFEPSAGWSGAVTLPLVSREETASEWAAQEPLPEYGSDPYADRISTEAAVQDEDGFAAAAGPEAYAQPVSHPQDRYVVDIYAAGARAAAAGDLRNSAYAAPGVLGDLDAEIHNAFVAPPQLTGTVPAATSGTVRRAEAASDGGERQPPVHSLSPDAQADEIARAVSVAVAYFEDSLGAAPEVVLSAGPLGAEVLGRTLREQGVAQADGLRVRELIDASMTAAEATTSTVPRSWLAGVTGALRS